MQYEVSFFDIESHKRVVKAFYEKDEVIDFIKRSVDPELPNSYLEDYVNELGALQKGNRMVIYAVDHFDEDIEYLIKAV